MKKKLVILCADDAVWSLPCWSRTLPALKAEHYEVSGFVTTSYSPSIGCVKQSALSWYMDHFGIWNFIKMAGFACISRFASLIYGRPQSFERLCRQYDVPYHAFRSVKDPDLLQHFQNVQPDIVAFMVPEIIPVNLIQTCSVGMINQHPSLLPKHKGLFPYIYAVIKGDNQGATLHSIDAKIDEGEMLYQYPLDEGQTRTMVQTHYHVMRQYPEALRSAITGLLDSDARVLLTTGKENGEYNTSPDRSVMKQFFKNGGQIIRLQDLFLAWRNGSLK